jgi:NADH-quinone oxidoreductase subunit A
MAGRAKPPGQRKAFGLRVRFRADLEIAFLFPWATIFKEIVGTPEVRLFGFVEMLVFIAILVVGYVYAWVKGALDWE